MRRKPKRIAPRLANGDHRETIGHGLPPAVKAGLRRIARAENQSVSWVLEQVIIRYFGMDDPEYVERPSDKDAPPSSFLGASRRRAPVISTQ